MPKTTVLAVLAWVALAAPASSEIQRVLIGGGQIYPLQTVVVTKDFVRDFDPSYVANSTSASASLTEKSGGVSLPGIFLHPGAGDAVLRYQAVRIGAAGGRHMPFLVFRIGLRDDIPWDHPSAPDGVRFSVVIDGQTAFQEDHKGDGWQARAIDLAPWQGRRVDIEFRTHAIDRSNYDWAAFGQPLVVNMPLVGAVETLPAQTNGIALARIACAVPSVITVSCGDASERAALSEGAHWVPVHFDTPAPVELAVEEGRATLDKVVAAVHQSQVENVGIALSSPLLIAGEPFAILLTLRNTGLGAYTDPGRMVLPMRPAGPAAAASFPEAAELPIGRLEPGEEKTLVWDGLIIAEPGSVAVDERLVRVMPPAPDLPADRSAQPRVTAANPAEGAAVGIVGTVENGQARLSLVGDRGAAYAIAETWNGTAWQRLGTLYPLARLVTGATETGPLELDPVNFRFDAEGDGLVVRMDFATPDDGRPVAQATLAFRPALRQPGVSVEASLQARQALPVAAFSGPAVLAGDRAFGVEKDFAIFPGLEYLEGDEPSSSTRDLAYPLSDRRVPATHKIATPLTAVQARDGLIALLWDQNQEWAPGEKHPAARFLAPAYRSGYRHIHMSLFAPSVGDYVKENQYQAEKPYDLKAGEALRLATVLILDHASNQPADSIVHGPRKGGLVLQAMRHYFEVFGLPAASELPRPWDAVRDLSRHAYHDSVWSEDPAGWGHCHGWDPLLAVSYAVPLLIDIEAGVPETARDGSLRRIDAVFDRALREKGPEYFWSGAGCHILMGELPFYAGHLPEAFADMRRHAQGMLDARENGLWVWRPHGEKMATLGNSGDHTVSQAAQPSYIALRTARLTGDLNLMRQSLEAMKQMERYEVPRGAQTWECPLYQPDILAAAQAVRAYTEAYRLTGDAAHLDQARYWAWTGLPFLYTWEMDGYPTMRYNVIAVMGSTFYTHSWIGLPVVWCGLVYAYALQDFAEFDDSFPWKQVAEGITHSAIWQQYPDGPSQGCYPDSWDMLRNGPNPADINPENILVNGFRLRGLSPEPRFVRIEGRNGPAFLNAAGDIADLAGSLDDRSLAFTLEGRKGLASYALLAPVPEPTAVEGAGEKAADSAALQSAAQGWFYAPSIQAVVFKTPGNAPGRVSLRW